MKHCPFSSLDQNIFLLLYPGLSPHCCPPWQCVVVMWKPVTYLKKLSQNLVNVPESVIDFDVKRLFALF